MTAVRTTTTSCARVRACVVWAFVLLGALASCRHPDVELHGPDGCAIPAPHDPIQALDAIDRLIDPDDRERLRQGEFDAYDFYRGLGSGIREAWGLWSGRGDLAAWFHSRGVFGAESLSMILLQAYTRRLRGQPIELEQALEQRRAAQREELAALRAKLLGDEERPAKVAKARMGWRYVDRKVPILESPLPQLRAEGFVPVRLEPYRGGDAGGVLIVARGSTDDSYPADGAQSWHGGIWWLDSRSWQLRTVERTDCPAVIDVLTVGEATYWLCNGDEAWWLVRERAGQPAEIERVPSPEPWARAWIDTSVDPTRVDGFPEYPTRSDPPIQAMRLGSAGDEIVLHEPTKLWRRRAGRWEVMRLDRCEFPAFSHRGGPTRVVGDVMYVPGSRHDELDVVERYDLDEPGAELRSARAILIEDHYGEGYGSLHSLVPSSDGGLWITGGHRGHGSLFHVDRSGAIGLAVFDGTDRRPRFRRGVVRSHRWTKRRLHRLVPSAAVAELGDTIYLAGDEGVARSRDGRIEPMIRFRFASPDRRAIESMAALDGLVVLDDGDERPTFVLSATRVLVLRPRGAGYVAEQPRTGPPIAWPAAR